MNKEKINGLIFYFQSASQVDEGIRTQVMEVLNNALARIAEDEAIAARKHKSPNKSGVVQIDAETGKILAEYETQKEATEAIGRPGKSGLGDALNGRTKTHMAYGYRWYFKDELQRGIAAGHIKK